MEGLDLDHADSDAGEYRAPIDNAAVVSGLACLRPQLLLKITRGTTATAGSPAPRRMK
jgi:hypothetical protein